MNQHVDKAMELRNEMPMVNNCAQTIMRVYADELGMNEEQAAAIGCNFGGGMKCGGTCGAITSGLMVLGAMGIDSPKVVGEYRKRMAGMHDGLTDCAALLQENARKGGEKKVHCDIIHFLRREMLDFTAFPVFFVSNLLLVQRKKYYFNRATVSRNCSIVL